jgi:hypothetical protein
MGRGPRQPRQCRLRHNRSGRPKVRWRFVSPRKPRS